MTLVFHLVLADDLVEDVPMGVFEVSEANRLAKCLELKAYDFMLRFDKSFRGILEWLGQYAPQSVARSLWFCHLLDA